MFTTVSAGLVAVLVGALTAALSLVAGLLASILHRVDGATWPTAVRAGGRPGRARRHRCAPGRGRGVVVAGRGL